MTDKPANTELTAAHCSTCGRFIGPVGLCPYCGARHKNAIPIIWLKIAALLLALVGLAFIWVWAKATDVPLVRIGDISATMNLAYARVQGTIPRDITYDPETNYLSFWITDDTGEIYVSCYEDSTTELIEAGNIPEVGDSVEIAGTLRIREDFLSMTLNTIEHLALTHPAAENRMTRQITVLDEGSRVRVTGIINNIRHPYSGLVLVDIEDSQGNLTLTVGETITQLTGLLPEMSPGYHITAEGTVTLYRGTPQLTLTHSGDIAVAPPGNTNTAGTPAETPGDTQAEAATVEPEVLQAMPLQDISKGDLGRYIRTGGQIVLLEGINGGVKAMLDNGVVQVPLVLWMDVYEALPDRYGFDTGADVELHAKVSVYEGEVELIALAADDINVITAALSPDWVSIGDLSEADVGRRVRIRGITGEPEGFSAGAKIPLQDGSGTITILLWANIYDAIPGKLSADMPVEITGIIQEYNGEMEIIPRTQYDWVRIED